MKTIGEFIRFGNLSPQYHKIPKDPEDRSFHTPPVAKGIYAFPRGFIEPFLIGGAGGGSLQNGRYRKLRDENGKAVKIAYDDYENFADTFPNKKLAKRFHYAKPKYDDDRLENCETFEDCENYWRENGPYEVWIENTPSRFNHKGLIWHHLFNSEDPTKDKEYKNYIKIVDSWVLTDMKTYLRCLKAMVGKDKWTQSFKYYYGDPEEKGKRHVRKKSPYWNYGGIPYPCSKDHFEVYIEKL